MARSKRAEADEAYRRTEAELLRRTQLDAFAAPAVAPTIATVDGVPEVCDGCKRRQTLVAGWTPLTAFTTGLGTTVYPIQCGNCGLTVLVPEAAQLALRAAIGKLYREREAALAPLKPARERKTRGAG